MPTRTLAGPSACATACPTACPTILATTTAVPRHTASQGEVKKALRTLFPLEPRRLEAVMAIFDHAQIDKRYSVFPVDNIGKRKSLTQTTQEYRTHAIALAQDVAARCLAQARLKAAEIDLII